VCKNCVHAVAKRRVCARPGRAWSPRGPEYAKMLAGLPGMPTATEPPNSLYTCDKVVCLPRGSHIDEHFAIGHATDCQPRVASTVNHKREQILPHSAGCQVVSTALL
jgi:hypothetical protein